MDLILTLSLHSLCEAAMPRKARLDAPGTLHHVITRGIEKRRIVHDDKDRLDFVRRMGELAQDTDTPIYAWTLLPNHAHILLRSGPSGLSKYMRRLLTGYAVNYNLRHHRHGHLFQNRYKSIVCDEDTYFRELVRYIHLNPLRAQLVKDISELDRYPWCGHAVLMGHVRHQWQARDYVLSWFGHKKGSARTAYREYVIEGVSQGKRDDLVGGGLVRSLGGWSEVLSLRRTQQQTFADERILGTGQFVDSVLMESSERMKFALTSIEVRERMQNLIEKRCKEEDINIDEIRLGSRRGRIPQVRADIAWELVNKLGISLAEAARQLGVSTSAIAKSLQRKESKP